MFLPIPTINVELGRGVNLEIVQIAKAAFDDYDWQLSSDIRRLIGSVTINS
jgi:hypothetical protein